MAHYITTTNYHGEIVMTTKFETPSQAPTGYINQIRLVIETQFSTPFQMSTRCMNQASIVMADGHYVETLRQAASRRAIFYFDDCPRTRMLIDMYERKECLPIPAKTILNCRTELYHQALRVVRAGEL